MSDCTVRIASDQRRRPERLCRYINHRRLRPVWLAHYAEHSLLTCEDEERMREFVQEQGVI